MLLFYPVEVNESDALVQSLKAISGVLFAHVYTIEGFAGRPGVYVRIKSPSDEVKLQIDALVKARLVREFPTTDAKKMTVEKRDI